MHSFMIVCENADGDPVLFVTGNYQDKFPAECEARERLAKHVREERAAGRDVTAADFRLVRTRQVVS